LQALPLVLDPLPLALGPLQLAPQALVLLPQPLDLAFAVVPRRRPPPPGHRHGCKKAYLGLRIYNALRRGTLTEYPFFWGGPGFSRAVLGLPFERCNRRGL